MRPVRAGTASAHESFMQRRLTALTADPLVRRVALLAVFLLLAACKQGGNGGGY